MEQRELERRIKNTLITKKEADEKTVDSLLASLDRAEDYFFQLTKYYKPKEPLIRALITKKTKHHIPIIYSNLIKCIEKYLYVVIIPKKEITEEHEIINTYYIIAPKDQALIAVYYIDYLYTVIEAITDYYRNKHRLEAKQKRRKLRRGTGDELAENTKTYSSEIRKKLVDNIVKYLYNHYYSRISKENSYHSTGINRGITIRTYLREKYGKSWLSKLSN